MSDDAASLLPVDLRTLRTVLVGVADERGNLVDANRGLLDLLGRGSLPERGVSVAPFFRQPPWKEVIKLARAARMEGEAARFTGRVHIGDPAGSAKTYEVILQESHGIWSFIGEPPAEDAETGADLMARLIEDLAEAHRELSRSSRWPGHGGSART